jgi:hypothetical protein
MAKTRTERGVEGQGQGPRRAFHDLQGERFRSIHEDIRCAVREDRGEGFEQQDQRLQGHLEKGVIDEAYANGGVLEEGAGVSILQSLDNGFAHQLIPDDPLLLKYGLALCSGYRSLSEAAINHFMGLRTDLEHSVRQALHLTETSTMSGSP